VGVCPQNIVLWERLTCVEQLVFIGQMYSLPAHRAQASADRLLKDLDLLEKANQQARTLSGGMQRRLNLAMALVHDPEIVVLDEPEAGLDPQSRVRVREYIQSLARKKTVILTTHNMDEADRLADRVAIIDHGRLLVVDTPERLKQSLGEGDVIEIHLAGQAGENTLAPLMANLGPGLSYESEGGLLRLRLSNAASRLPALLETLQTAGLQPGEISIRQKSLEDVFIQLTGRTLRE
jgi:ABC-2 type transport system ATP-binding protein